MCVNTDRLFRLDEKTALVTGASRGLGKAIALGFANAGADLILLSRNSETLKEVANEIREMGRKAFVFEHDVARTDQIPKVFEKMREQVGRIDILTNVAGVNLRNKAETFDAKTWQFVLDVNLTAPFVFAQQFCLACKQERHGGKIINISSLLSEQTRPSIPAYTASKGGIKQLTKALAVEWAEYGINVNAIGPGYFETEMTAPLVQNPTFNQFVIDSTPMRRWGNADELVGAALFLASPASDFVTGQSLYVDGGWLANL
jgi:NAD(P)-dependent dehydrogenase (short-subunit alcohol dehydrogenase family)